MILLTGIILLSLNCSVRNILQLLKTEYCTEPRQESTINTKVLFITVQVSVLQSIVIVNFSFWEAIFITLLSDCGQAAAIAVYEPKILCYFQGFSSSTLKYFFYIECVFEYLHKINKPKIDVIGNQQLKKLI